MTNSNCRLVEKKRTGIQVCKSNLKVQRPEKVDLKESKHAMAQIMSSNLIQLLTKFHENGKPDDVKFKQVLLLFKRTRSPSMDLIYRLESPKI